MIAHDDFDRAVSRWLDEQAGQGMPGYLDEVLARTTRTRQRPWWSSLERWLPGHTTHRFAPAARMAWLLIALALVVMTAAAFLLIGVGQRRIPHFGSVANGSIAFVDGGDLKVAAADGATVRVASGLADGAEALRFSPDGMHLAYRSTGTPASLVVADADGSHPVAVSGDAAVAEGKQIAYWGPFAWAPDSRRLVFTATVTDGTSVIDIVDSDGSNLAPLISGSVDGVVDRFDPAWSPDGRWISFFSKGPASASVALNVSHPDGSDARPLPMSPINPEYLEASWAPNPSQARLAYVSGDDVKIFDVDNSQESDVGPGFFSSWSPDARRIAWWDAPVGAVTAPASGGTLVADVGEVLAGRHTPVRLFPAVDNQACFLRLTVEGICGPVEWSPDSTWIFGPDPSRASIVFSTVDEPRTVRSIRLDHPFTEAAGSITPRGSLAWQPVAP